MTMQGEVSIILREKGPTAGGITSPDGMKVLWI